MLEAEGPAECSKQISPLPPGGPLARLLSPVAPKPLPPRTLQPFFHTRWTSRLTTSHTFQAPSPAVVTETVHCAHFHSIFWRGGSECSPTSHGLARFLSPGCHFRCHPMAFPDIIPQWHSKRNRGRLDCHPERRAQPVAEGSAW